MAVVNSFLWLIAYSFGGWVYESALCSAREKRFVNRGFLNGPLCPVYGFGALALVLTLYGRLENVFLLFIAGMALTCAVEYVTAVILEVVFRAKWWDYSSHRFNLHGRICLAGALAFGAFAVVLIRYIHPFVLGVTDTVPRDVRVTLAVGIAVLTASDLFITVRHLLRLNNRLAEIQAALDSFLAPYAKRAEEITSALMEKFESSEFYSERISKLLSFSRIQTGRIAKAFPKLRPLNYNDAWEKMKQRIFRNGKS